MGSCCAKSEPQFSFKDCLKNITIKSNCMSSCCVKQSNIDNKIKEHQKYHHHHKHKHHHKTEENEKKL